jgi:hypothetical protein
MARSFGNTNPTPGTRKPAPSRKKTATSSVGPISRSGIKTRSGKSQGRGR